MFGGSKEIEEAKKATSEIQHGEGDKKELIRASLLDYHVFRQEITSKYPAYIPPQPPIPLEPEQSSIIPPLHNYPSRTNGQNGILPGPPGQSGGASILHQPVHIATPAPSPPPSPAVGKGGKKQNYQTNQNFPFMYPPLDATSNSAGGKGGAGLQDLLVGRKWEGSDVPSSILEAAELFSRRVKMTRATRQLWDESERFLKFERGWEGPDDDLIDELDLSSLTLEEKKDLGLAKPDDEEEHKAKEPEVDYGPHGVPPDIKQRLDAVEDFYVCLLNRMSRCFADSLTEGIVATSPVAGHCVAQGHHGDCNQHDDASQRTGAWRCASERCPSQRPTRPAAAQWNKWASQGGYWIPDRVGRG